MDCLFNVAFFCYKLPVSPVPGVARVCTMFSNLIAAPSSEMAEEISLDVLRKSYPESEGYAGHVVCVSAASRDHIEEVLAKAVEYGAAVVEEDVSVN